MLHFNHADISAENCWRTAQRLEIYHCKLKSSGCFGEVSNFSALKSLLLVPVTFKQYLFLHLFSQSTALNVIYLYLNAQQAGFTLILSSVKCQKQDRWQNLLLWLSAQERRAKNTAGVKLRDKVERYQMHCGIKGMSGTLRDTCRHTHLHSLLEPLRPVD